MKSCRIWMCAALLVMAALPALALSVAPPNAAQEKLDERRWQQAKRLREFYDTESHWRRAVEEQSIVEGRDLLAYPYEDWGFGHSRGHFQLVSPNYQHAPDKAACIESYVVLHFKVDLSRKPQIRGNRNRFRWAEEVSGIRLAEIEIVSCPDLAWSFDDYEVTPEHLRIRQRRLL